MCQYEHDAVKTDPLKVQYVVLGRNVNQKRRNFIYWRFKPKDDKLKDSGNSFILFYFI